MRSLAQRSVDHNARFVGQIRVLKYQMLKTDGLFEERERERERACLV